MPGPTKEQFLARVRKALSNRGKPVDLPDSLEVARVIAADVDQVAVFMQRAEEAYIKPYRVANEEEMVEKITEIVERLGAKSAIVPEDELPGRIRIVERLEGKGLTIRDVNEPDVSFEVDVGITGVVGAIAETASVIVTSGGGRRRLASLAVPVHIAVVRSDQIVADSLDWFAEDRTGAAASEVLISAPSKTADIELTLVMGVHGPKEEHVIVIG